MTTPNSNNSATTNKTSTRKFSSLFRSPEKSESKKDQTSIRSRTQSKAELPETLTTKPSTTTTPLIGSSKGDAAMMPGTAGSTTTSTTTGTTTSTTTSTITTSTTSSTSISTTTATATTTATSTSAVVQSADTRLRSDPNTPRPSWMHFLPLNTPRIQGVLDHKVRMNACGPVRQKELLAMRETLKGKAAQTLFAGRTGTPTLWLKQFCDEAFPVWSDVLQRMEDACGFVEIQRACAEPGKHLDTLERLFSEILKCWMGKGQAAFDSAFPLPAKAMGAEVLHQFNLAHKESGKKADLALFKDLMADLLVSSLIGAKGAPSPLTGLFANYLAVFLGRPPMQPDLFRMSDTELESRVNLWASRETVAYLNFQPLQALLSFQTSPLQEFQPDCHSPEFRQEWEIQESRLRDLKVMTGMSAKSDPDLIGVLERELASDTGVRAWQEMTNGQAVDISYKPDAMKKLMNKHPVQCLVAQHCCTQGFHHAAKFLLFGQSMEKTPFTDMAARAVAPYMNSYAAAWTIERTVADALEITCVVTAFIEQAQVVLGLSDWRDRDNVVTRMLLPGWTEISMKVSVDSFGDMQLKHLACSAYNLHLLEDMPEMSPLPVSLPDENGKSEPRSPRKVFKRLSAKFTAPAKFEESETPASRSLGNGDRDDSPRKPRPKTKEKQ